MVANKLQDVEVTARWHNIWFGTSIAFFATTALFAGLFGGYYSAWSHRPPCDNDEQWVHGNGTDFDDACHIVGDDGLYAIPGKACPSECDTWWHAKHPLSPTTSDGRRLEMEKLKTNPKSKTFSACAICQKRFADIQNGYVECIDATGVRPSSFQPTCSSCNKKLLRNERKKLNDCQNDKNSNGKS